MATATHGKAAEFWLADNTGTSRDLTTYFNKAGLARQADTAESSTFGDDDKTYVVGLRDATLSVEGIHDITVDGYFTGLLGHGTPAAWKFFPEGSVTGNVVLSGSAILTSYEPNADLGDIVGISAELQCSGAITRGTV